MKVIDTIQKIEKDLSYDELVDLMANHNRQVDLILTGKKSDEDGHVWDAENWTCVDGKRFIVTYSLQGRVLSEYGTYNKYDMKGVFEPEKAKEIRLN